MDPERLDTLCRADMRAVTAAATQIEQALDHAAQLVNRETWTGPPADRWSAEFIARVRAVKALLSNVEAEQQRLIQRSEREQSALDRKAHATN